MVKKGSLETRSRIRGIRHGMRYTELVLDFSSESDIGTIKSSLILISEYWNYFILKACEELFISTLLGNR